MKIIKRAGATSQILQIFIADSSSSTGAGLTGLVFNSASLTAYFHRDTDTTATAIALVTMTVGTFTSSGFKEIDATNMPGWYQFCPPNTALASGAAAVAFHLKGASNMAPLPIEMQLVAFDPDDTVRLGLTALPNAAAAANGGLPILGTNAFAISFTAGMTVSNASGDALTLSSSGGNGNGVTVAGNGSGQGLKLTAGATGHGLYVLGGATSGSAARIESPGPAAQGLHILGGGSGAGLQVDGGATGPGVKVNGGATSGDGIDIVTTSGDGLSILPTAGNGIVATANGTSKHGAVITGGTAGTSDGVKAVAGTGGVDLRANITGNVTGNLSGSAGSVTGAVASVTGNVGGNVTGSVGSVVATVAANLTQILGTALTETAGQLAAAFKKFFNIATPASTMDALTLVATATTVTNRVTANTDQLAGQTVTAGAGVTFPASIASPTNITAGTITTATNLTNAPTAGDFTATMKTSLNSSTPGISATGVQAIWDALTSALTTAGSIGKVLAALPGSIWDVVLSGHLTAGTTGAALNSSSSAGDPWATSLPGAYASGTAGNIVGNNLNATVSSRLPTASITLAAGAVTVGTNNDKTGYALTAAYDPAKTASQVGDAMALTSGERSTLAGIIWANATRTLTSFGTLVADAATAVWAAGSRTLSAFGFTVATDVSSTVTTNLDATVSSRLATSGYTVPPTATENADGLLKRDMSAVSGEAARSPLNALRFLRNKWSLSGSALTVTKENDTTTAWTATVGTTPGADPVTSSDPA